MSNYIQFEECDTPEKFSKLREFAATFEPKHFIPDNNHRFIIIKKDGIWIGYSEIVSTPLVFSSWCKSRCTPRDILDGMKAFVGWSKIQYGEGYTAVPLDTRTFPEKIMNRLGFYRLNVEVYKAS